MLRRVPSAVCRQQPSDDGERFSHSITSHSHAFLSNPGTHHIPLSAGIAQEHVVVAHSQMVEAFCENERFSTFSVGFVRALRATRPTDFHQSLFAN